MRAKQLISGCVFGSILTGGAATLSAQNGTLTGTLIDIENGAPLVSADGEVLGSGRTTISGPAILLRVRSRTVTSASGQFTISLAPGTYSLVISTLGYRDHREDDVRIRGRGDHDARSPADLGGAGTEVDRSHGLRGAGKKHRGASHDLCGGRDRN